MRILITGHKGFIGQNLFKHLVNKGHTVEGYDYIPDVMPDVTKHDQVIHLGAISSTTETDVEKIMIQNFDFSCKLLYLCDMMGINFQYASSASVYGLTKNFKEDAAMSPLSAYAWSKFLFDRMIKSVPYSEYNISVQGFRYFNVYGAHEEHKGNQASPISKFIQQAQQTGVIKLFENSEKYLRDFVCVDDVCDVHEQMLTKDVSGIFNVGTGTPTSFAEVAEIIAKKYNARIELVPMPTQLKAQYQTYTCADTTLLNTHVNIQYKTIEEYIRNDRK
jgi:ADP-L-glycero-D-manno-heptose 6-epimerase